MKNEAEVYVHHGRLGKVTLAADVELPCSKTGKAHPPLRFLKGQVLLTVVEDCGGAMRPNHYVVAPSNIWLQVPPAAIACPPGWLKS